MEMWTDVYRPQSIADLVGNDGNVNALYEWLRDWDDVQIRGMKKDIPFRRGANWQDIPKPNAKAVLLSGPPGIGKTCAARIVCQELGFEIMETNASDTRNKAVINNALKDLSSNQSLNYFSMTGQQTAQDRMLKGQQALQDSKKPVIVMDEVDGVGAGDRGGIQALIQVIKVTKCPIICICNDRQSQKLKSLINYCYDLKFQRPSLN